MSAKKSCPPAVSASTNYALPKRFSKKSGLGSRIINIGFSARAATKIISIISTVNSASRFIPTAVKTRMTISGSAVTVARDG